jgi:hypothetical protein
MDFGQIKKNRAVVSDTFSTFGNCPQKAFLLPPNLLRGERLGKGCME